jgi:hypothetical protein
MSAPLPLSAPNVRITRTGLAAAGSVVLASVSIAVTLAVSTGGSADEPAAPGGAPTTAQPDAAKTYHHAMRAR